MTCKKQIYQSKKEAKTILNIRLKHKRDVKILAIYLCKYCHYWHLTSHFGQEVKESLPFGKTYFEKKK